MTLYSAPLPPRSGGEGLGVGGGAAFTEAAWLAEAPPTPNPSPPRAMRVGGGERIVPDAPLPNRAREQITPTRW